MSEHYRRAESLAGILAKIDEVSGDLSPDTLAPLDQFHSGGLGATRELARLAKIYPKMLMNDRIEEAFLSPPKSPADCTFARMSLNYSADLKTRVEPCIFGGAPDCSQCGCAISSGLHWLKTVKAGPVQIETLVDW